MATVLAGRSGEWNAGDLADYGRSNLERFTNTALVDPVRRVARNPLINWAGETPVGPAREAARKGLPVGALCDAIAAGLTLSDDRVAGVDDLVLALDAGGWQSVLGPDPEGHLTDMLRSRMVCPGP